MRPKGDDHKVARNLYMCLVNLHATHELEGKPCPPAAYLSALGDGRQQLKKLAKCGFYDCKEVATCETSLGRACDKHAAGEGVDFVYAPLVRKLQKIVNPHVYWDRLLYGVEY